MLPIATEYQVRINEIRFATLPELGHYSAKVSGFIKPHGIGNLHTFKATADYDVEKRIWEIDLRSFQWTSPVARCLFDLKNVESICKALVSCFRLLWTQPAPGASEGGAKLQVGHTFMSERQCHDAISIVRGDILSLYMLGWSRLWPAIENRLAHDPEFWVKGFTRQDAMDAVTTLKNVFPWEWVRRRYRDVATKPSEVGMWDMMQADQGFPAYLLARTAIGCICKDPGWNYLITLARSCNLLQSFPKGASLLQRVAREPGHIHQANFSGYILERQLLLELEPSTGSGNAKHDMTARAGDVAFDIEMKALTTAEPARQIEHEIVDKCRKLPSSPPRPVVFFVLLVETSIRNERKTWQEQLNLITPSIFDRTTGVSCVVVGQMFVDSVGGPIKWSFDKFILNDRAFHPLNEQVLRLVFRPNSQQLAYPLMPIVFTYNLTSK